MNIKDVTLGSDAREPILEGVKILSDVVRATMGPKGQNALIKRHVGYLITKDGVTAANAVQDSENKLVNLGMQVMKDVAKKTNDIAGDGTSTSIVLAGEMISLASKRILAGYNAVGIKRGMEIASLSVIENLEKQAKAIKTNKDIENVANISANGEKEIGRLIADTINTIGKYGVIQLEESKSNKTYVDIIEGMQIDRGYISPVFINNRANREIILEDAYILMIDKKITTANEIIPILEEVVATNSSLLIVADDVEGEALSTLLLNKTKGMKIATIKAPGFDEARLNLFTDLAIFTGGQYITREDRVSLEAVGLSVCGKAKKITINEKETIFYGGYGDKKDVKERVSEITELLKNTKEKFIKEKYEARISKLNNGIAVMYVGGTTEAEMKERRDRAEDALNATRSAIEEGILPGGGKALINCIGDLSKLEVSNEDELIGVRIIQETLEKPFKQIIENAGISSDTKIEKVKASKNKSFGYNSYTNEYGDLIKLGIIDPLKVTKNAFINAVSISGLLTTIESVIFENPNYEV